MLGVNYVISDKVNASITLRTANPVDKAALLEIFDSVLRAEGISVVAEGGVYKIVPELRGCCVRSAAAAQGRPTEAALGVASEIVPLRFVAAAEMERILKSAAPNASVLRADTNRNVLLISGTKAELASMTELVRVFDVDWMRGMSFGIFPVEASDPEAIAQELDVIFANDKDSPSKGLVRFVPNRRLKSVLVISQRPEYLKKAETWIARIDLASASTEKRVFVYHVQNRPAAEVAQLLQKVYRAGSGGAQQQQQSLQTAGIIQDPTKILPGSPGDPNVWPASPTILSSQLRCRASPRRRRRPSLSCRHQPRLRQRTRDWGRSMRPRSSCSRRSAGGSGRTTCHPASRSWPTSLTTPWLLPPRHTNTGAFKTSCARWTWRACKCSSSRRSPK